MRPARIIATVVVVAAVAVTGCSTNPAATRPSPAPQHPETAPPLFPMPTTPPQPGPGPNAPPSTTSPPGGPAAPGRCAASVLAGSVQGSEGAAGTIYTTIQLRNTSKRTCTVKGIPQVRLLGAQGQPLTAPSTPAGPAGSLVVLRPGQAARVVMAVPNACDSFVVGSRLRVTLPAGHGSVVVPLGGETRFGTCASVRVRALEASAAPSTPTKLGLDRIADPQLAANRLVTAWLRGDRAAAGTVVTSQDVIERLFREAAPAERPAALPCRLAEPGLYVCSYPLAEHAELSVFVVGGASVGYGVRGIEFGD